MNQPAGKTIAVFSDNQPPLMSAAAGKTAASRPGTARIGQISFINCLPVVLPFQKQDGDQVILGSPAQLNTLYLSGQLDLGAMSSFFFLQQDDLTLVPDVSISCRGPVGSVLLFSKLPLAQLNRQVIQVASSSATSVNLLSILLKEEFGVSPILIPTSSPEISDTCQAALVIGDRALAVDEQWSKNYLRVDLGQWWWQQTSSPMVFGLWGAKNDFCRDNTQHFDNICQQLVSACKTGLSSMLTEVISVAHERTGLSKQRLEKYYLGELDFSFGNEHFHALNYYRQLSVKHGLLR